MKTSEPVNLLVLSLCIAFLSFSLEGYHPAGNKKHRLNFDFSFVDKALEYLESGDEEILITLAQSSAAAHLWRHARDMNPVEQTGSQLSLVKSLLTPRLVKIDSIHLVHRNLSHARKFVKEERTFVQATLSLLPSDFIFDGSLFFTYGYDIGVAHGDNASLNLAHPKFLEKPKEMLFYAAHELHHIGFMKYNPFPVLHELRTAEDLVHLIEYSTQMEGMAVYAAYGLREDEGALDDDEDYVKLQDEEWMRKNEDIYFSLYYGLKKRGTKKIRNRDWDIIEIFSDKKRLWYRIGCRIAMKIEEAMGRDFLIQLINKEPDVFIQKYLELKYQQ